MQVLASDPRLILASVAAERERRELARVAREADEIRFRCRTLAGFVREAWPILEPRARYTHGWHIDAICEHLEAVTRGEVNRLLINVPPGSSKSLLTSVIWPAWEWGPAALPSLRYLATSFNEGPVKRDTRKSRDLILSAWFQALWPLRLPRTGETSFANEKTGTREGVAFGSLTSQRGDRLLIDDPHSTETAESDAERTRTTRQFREGALDRLNDLERSAIVCIMQRLHANDVAGVIESLPELGFVQLVIPMEFEPERRCSTRIGWTDPRTEAGELMEPIRFGRDAVEKLKIGKGSYAYASQYQQRPAPREGGMMKRRWLPIVEAAPANLRRVRRWDLAATVAGAGRDPDWTAGALLGRDAAGFVYLLDMIRFRGSSHEVESAILNTARQDGTAVTVGLPQDPGQAGKAQVGALVRMLSGWPVKFAPETGSKETRASPFAAQLEAGNVKMVRGAWNDAFLGELDTFPFGSHDDQVDAVTGGFNLLADGLDAQGWVDMMAARADGAVLPASDGDDRFAQHVAYIRNTGLTPLPVAMFDDDWAPIGPTLRRDMTQAGLITEVWGGIQLR